MKDGGLEVALVAVFVIIAYPIAFYLLWSFVLRLMAALGGWSRLGIAYPAPPVRPGGRTFRGLTGMVGIASYRRALTVTVAETGLLIDVSPIFRAGHKPLFIPYADMHDFGRRSLMFRDYAAFDVGMPKLASVRLPLPLFEGTPVVIPLR